MAEQLHDANLRRAREDLEHLRRALPLAADLISSPDWITPVLSWIDWDESGLAHAAGFLDGGASTGAQLLESIAHDLHACSGRLLENWRGPAADVFDGYAEAVASNCREIARTIKAVHRLAAPGASNGIVDGMKALTRNVREKAARIADEPAVRHAIRDINDAAQSGDLSGSGVQARVWPILDGALEDLKSAVEIEVTRIPEVFAPLRRFTQPSSDLKNPSAEKGKAFSDPRHVTYSLSAFRDAEDALAHLYIEDFPTCDSKLNSASEIGGALGDSQEAHDAETLWGNAVACCGAEAYCCKVWVYRMIEGLALTSDSYHHVEVHNVDGAVDLYRESYFLSGAYRGDEAGDAYQRTEGELSGKFPGPPTLGGWIRGKILGLFTIEIKGVRIFEIPG